MAHLTCRTVSEPQQLRLNPKQSESASSGEQRAALGTVAVLRFLVSAPVNPAPPVFRDANAESPS